MKLAPKVLKSAAQTALLIAHGMITDWPHEVTPRGRKWLRLNARKKTAHET